MENVIEVQPEEIKPEDKPVKKTTSKKKITPKKIKLTDEIYNLIIKRNREEGKPFHLLCEEYNVSESSFNYQRAKMKDSAVQKKIPKVKNIKSASNVTDDPIDQLRKQIKEMEKDFEHLKKAYMELFVQYNRLKEK